MPYVIAHRGTSGRFPENTLPAFEHAIHVGADSIEFDVVSTADGEVVVSHDTSVDRCTDGTGKIRMLTLEQIRQFDAGVRFDESFAGLRIPTLDKTLDFFEAYSVRLSIEIKGDDTAEYLATARRTVEMLLRRGMVQRVLMTAFNAECLRAIKLWEPTLATGLDPDHQDGTYTPWELCQQVMRCGANFLLHRHETLTPDIIDEAHQHGFSLWTWTPNTAADMRRVIDMGTDAIMTDYPDVLRSLVDGAA